MLKKSKKQKITSALNRASGPVRGIWPKLPDAVIGLFSIAIVVFCVLTYSTPLAHYTSRLFNGNKVVALVDGLFNPFRNRHILLKSGLPIYDIKMRRQQRAIIDEAVEQAKKQGWMSDDMKVWANASFIHDGQSYNVKVRVRGDLPAHWKGPKKSWRIKFGKRKITHNGETRKEPIYFQGKRQINLIIPIDRDYILAYFINSIMRKKGLVVPRDKFVILRINGVIQGLYYEVEHFDKPLLANNRRPETTVFGQNDRVMHFEQYTKLGTPAASDSKYDLGSMRRQVDREGELAMQAMQALIDHSMNPTDENFRRARAVLDWEKYLTFRVMTTLCNTNHVRFGSDNLRLYYDPSRGQLEPIPWDVHITKMPKEPGTIDFWNNHGPDEIQKATLLDPELRLQRNQILWKLVGDGGDSLISKYRKIHDRIRPFAWADVLTTPIQGHKMDGIKSLFEYNVRRVHKVLSNSGCNFMYRLESANRAALELLVNNFSGIKLQKIEIADSLLLEGRYQLFEDSNFNGKLDKQDPLIAETTAQNGRIRFDFDRYVLPKLEYAADIIDSRQWEFFDTKTNRVRFFLSGKLTPKIRHPLLWNPPDLKVAAENAVSGYRIPSAFISQTDPLPKNYIGITAYDHSDPFDLDAIDISIAEFLKRHPQFKASREEGAVELQGKVKISGTVIVPKSALLIVQPGADVTLEPAANILCYGGFRSVGTSERPIKIHGDGSGQPFGVLAIVRPKEKVLVKHTEMRDGGQAQVNAMLFTGGFAVHNGDLELESSQFIDMQSEDGVNLKNGHIGMKDCLFSNSASDGIDIDFGVGEIRNCTFINSRGDALDLSGSRVLIADCWFENIADKGVSVGENSHPILVNNVFQKCAIGFSTKDLSKARVAHCTFVNNNLAIEAKRKKPFFGGGSAEVVNSVFSGNQRLLSEDYFSSGLVSVSHSLVDVAVDWPTCKTTGIRFVDTENGDYSVDPHSIMGNGFKLVEPEWLQSSEFNNGVHQPGVFGSGHTKKIESSENNLFK
ncbi:MAG: CotH kinase family protein [bacterium]